MKIYRFWVYIVTNPGRTAFYIGFTGNLAQRLPQHCEAADLHLKDAHTGRYNCKHLVYYEEYQWAHVAIEREKALKKFSRARKLELIRSLNPNLDFLESAFIR